MVHFKVKHLLYNFNTFVDSVWVTNVLFYLGSDTDLGISIQRDQGSKNSAFTHGKMLSLVLLVIENHNFRILLYFHICNRSIENWKSRRGFNKYLYLAVIPPWPCPWQKTLHNRSRDYAKVWTHTQIYKILP